MTFCMWQLTLTSSCAAWTAFITLTALSWDFFDTCAVQCVTCCSLTAFFSLLCINLQVNMPLYLLWSPWTHLKTCGSLPLLNAFLPFPHHLPSSSRPLFLAQSTPSTPPRCHYFLPSSSLLIISSFFNQEVFFFFTSSWCVIITTERQDRIFHEKLLAGKSPNTAMYNDHCMMILILMRAVQNLQK